MDFGNAVVLGSNGALSVKHERIAEIIKDLDETLELAYIPEDRRSQFDKHPFAVIHRPRDGRPAYIAMTMPENEVDERVIAKLIKRDTHKGAVLDEMEANEAALRLVQAKAQMDEVEEKRDFAQTVLKSNLHTFRHNGRVYR
jgi:hypothetical protein